MILILIGMAFGIPDVLLFRHVIKNNDAKFVTLKSMVAVLTCFIAVMLITFGVVGVRIDEGNPQLMSTNNVVIQNYEDEVYEAFDERNNTLYYFGKAEVEVLKDGKRGMYGNKIIYDCKILEGDYDQPYIEFYEVDYKMNWWSFELIDRPEYILYVPKDGAQ